MRRMIPLAALLLWLPVEAHADGPDGLYGRFDGDLMVSVGAGGGWTSDGDAPAWLAELRARYLDSAGLVVASELHGSSLRLLAAADVRPLFPIRFLTNQWIGAPWVDLLIDSVGFEVGVAFDRPGEGEDAGLALVVGLGLDVPLLLPGQLAEGVFLRVGARHVRASAQDLHAPVAGVSDWTLYGALTVRFVADMGLASRETSR